MSIFDQIVEEKIRSAMQAGKFDHLPGKGQPLKLEEAPFTPEEDQLAYQLLKSNGFVLPWMEDRKEIEGLHSAAIQRLRFALDPAQPAARRTAALQAFGTEIELLNKRILGYNLRVPVPAFQMALLDAAQEIKLAASQPQAG